MSERTMEDIWKALIKQHGDEGLYHGDDDMTARVENVISTGSYALDDALGIWGLPRGRIVQFAGQQSSGKTLMSLLAIAEYQKQNPNGWAYFIDAEFTLDKQWAASLGVDLSRLMIYRENNGVKIFERLIGQPSKTGTKKAKLGLLDMEKENPTGLGLIVLDSVAFIQPPAELTSEVGKNNMALLARFLPPEIRKLTPLLSDTDVTFIGINQIRLDPNVMYGSPESSPGGTAFKHACSLMLNFAKMNGKESSIVDSSDTQIGHHIRMRVDKNKLAPPFRKAEVAILYTKGITEKNIEIRDLGAKYGVIERPNNKTWILNGIKYNGKDEIAEALLDTQLQQEVFEKIKEAKSKGVVISTSGEEENIESEKGVV